MLKTYKCYISPTCGNVSIVAKESTPGLSEVVHRSQVGQTPSWTWAIEAPALGLPHTSKNPSGPSLVTILLPPPPWSEKTALSVPGTHRPKGPQACFQVVWGLFP